MKTVTKSVKKNHGRKTGTKRKTESAVMAGIVRVTRC